MVCMPVVRLHGVTLDQSFRLLYRLLPCMSARHYDALCARYPCHVVVDCFFFKQKTAYVMRISDWSSDVGSSDLRKTAAARGAMLAGAWCCPPSSSSRKSASVMRGRPSLRVMKLVRRTIQRRRRLYASSDRAVAPNSAPRPMYR